MYTTFCQWIKRGLMLAGAVSAASCVHQVQSNVPAKTQNASRSSRIRADKQAQAAARTAPRNSVSSTMQRQIQNAIDAGEGDLEARALRQRLATNADDLDARIRLAKLYASHGLPDLAIEHYRMAAVRFPDSVAAALGLAKSLQGLGETDEALKSLDASLKNHPAGSWELLSYRAVLEDQSGHAEKAEASHRAALALEPGNASLHNNLGYNLLTQGRADQAAAEFRRAIEIDPRSEIAHNNLGAALASSKSSPAPKEALTELQRSTSPAIAHNNLAAVLIGQGRYAEARVELEAALRARPDFPAALSNLRLVADEDGQPITMPAPSPSVNFWKRATSAWTKLLAGTFAPKPAASGTAPADGATAGKN
jgi:Tfp pilus assembly protein PilF